MTAARFRLALVLLAVIVVSICSTTQAGDCCRRLGVGFSAGYNAAPACGCSTCGKWCGRLHWRGTCCHPGPVGCGCGMPAPACGCGPCGGCQSHNPGIY